MPLDSSAASALRQGGETLSLRQESAGAWTVATQSQATGTTTDTAVYGIVQLVETGIDGVNVLHGDLEAWLPKIVLDLYSVTPVVGNLLVRGSTVLRIVDVMPMPVQGLYHLRARAAE